MAEMAHPQPVDHHADNPLAGLDLDESPLAPPISEQLKQSLIAHSGRVIDLFSSWDEDGDGLVERVEFHRALRMLGLEVPDSALDELYDEWSHADRSGEINDSVMSLRDLAKALCAPTAMEKLRAFLLKRGARVLDTFFQYDSDGSGEISRDEFARGLAKAGLALPSWQVEQLFTNFDRDSGGTVTFKELKAALHRDRRQELAWQHAREGLAPAPEAPVELVDLVELKASVRAEVWRHQAGKNASAEATWLGATRHESDAEAAERRRALREKSAQIARRRLHLRLRLKGTGLDEQPYAFPGAHAGFDNNGRTVTRHGRLPAIQGLVSPTLLLSISGPDSPGSSLSSPFEAPPPKLLDVLSAHRTRSHAPARRHCHITLPPVQARPTRGRARLAAPHPARPEREGHAASSLRVSASASELAHAAAPAAADDEPSLAVTLSASPSLPNF